ncbi:MAG: elongation factor 4 [Candidatus Lindowbacteria bacterium]|nr:elongation factor 4 [Candidatus Lindowbacteria bacterium]
MIDQKYIRNFCIIAHIDHGKSTLADRMLEVTSTIASRDMKEQVLDGMDLERERGITIKAHPVRMDYVHPETKQEYLIHLIDTPGHVDFRYEVSRALAACEGAVLVVDAAQGVQAQTLANIDLALEENLTMIPVINKIDPPAADPDRVIAQLEDLGFSADEVLLASGKVGQGIEEILQAVIKRIEPPKGDPNAPLRALIFDSHYDSFLGAVSYLRVVDGNLSKTESIRMASSQKKCEANEVGVFRPQREAIKTLGTGCVGYVTASIKVIEDVRVGDTITADLDDIEPLEGYKQPLPMVFAGIYPINGEDYDDLRNALQKLRLNDASFSFEPETSIALGFGFRCGFLGLLHMEIITERLEREFGLALLTTAPSVKYEVVLLSGKMIVLDNPAELPPSGDIKEIREPFIAAKLYSPEEYVGGLMKLCQDKRGTLTDMKYPSPEKVILEYNLPLAEVVLDFFDKLKSISNGYASFDYEYCGHQPDALVRLDIRVNEEVVDALSAIVHRDSAYGIGRKLCEKLKELIPRHQFKVLIQASIGARIISRETIGALSKNVTAKSYGGDISRKRKLLEKQKAGKKRMKTIGNVEIPQKAFLAVLSMD